MVSIKRFWLIWIAGGAIVVIGTSLALVRLGSHRETLIVHPRDFESVVSVAGSVVAAKTVDLGFVQSGRIAGVYAAVGDMVRRSALLANIENDDLRAVLSQKEASLAVQEAKLAALRAGTRPEEIAVAQATVESDETALAQAKDAVANAIRSAFTQSDDAVRNKVDQFFNNPRTGNPTLTFPVSDASLRYAVEANRLAIESTLISWQRSVATLSLEDIARAETEAQANLEAVAKLLFDANAALNAAIYTSSIPQSVIAGYISAVAAARASIDGARNSLAAAITARRSAAAALERDQKTLALKRAGATPEDITAQEAQIVAARAEVDNARAQLQKTLIMAPFDGTITRMDVRLGQIVSPNISHITLISDNPFRIEVFVPEVNVAEIMPGQMATVTLDAYGSAEFPARVIAVDPAQTTVAGVSTYKTTLEFLSPDSRIKVGMTANVRIATRTLHKTFIVPQGALFWKDGEAFLRIERDGRDINMPVVPGESSLGNIEIASGLRDGDVVILNPSISR